MRDGVLVLSLLLVASVLPATAAPADGKDEVKMPDSARKATARALAWLAGKQNSDGQRNNVLLPALAHASQNSDWCHQAGDTRRYGKLVRAVKSDYPSRGTCSICPTHNRRSVER